MASIRLDEAQMVEARSEEASAPGSRTIRDIISGIGKRRRGKPMPSTVRQRAQQRKRRRSNNDEEPAPTPPTPTPPPPPRTEENVVAPQLKVDANGNIVIDRSSLIISAAADEEQSAVNVTAVEDYQNTKHITSASFSKREVAIKWETEETEQFYLALQKYGCDFSVMEATFEGRTRRQLKLKFKREERDNPKVVDAALAGRFELSMLTNDKASGDEGEEPTRRTTRRSRSVKKRGRGGRNDANARNERIATRSSPVATAVDSGTVEVAQQSEGSQIEKGPGSVVEKANAADKSASASAEATANTAVAEANRPPNVPQPVGDSALQVENVVEGAKSANGSKEEQPYAARTSLNPAEAEISKNVDVAAGSGGKALEKPKPVAAKTVIMPAAAPVVSMSPRPPTGSTAEALENSNVEAAPGTKSPSNAAPAKETTPATKTTPATEITSTKETTPTAETLPTNGSTRAKETAAAKENIPLAEAEASRQKGPCKEPEGGKESEEPKNTPDNNNGAVNDESDTERVMSPKFELDSDDEAVEDSASKKNAEDTNEKEGPAEVVLGKLTDDVPEDEDDMVGVYDDGSDSWGESDGSEY